MSERQHDVVVIGAGVGGLVSGVRLVQAGLKPLIIEATDRIGGRFSTIEKDGFRIPTGAIAIELNGPWHETFEGLGIDADLRIPDPAVRVRIRGRDVTAGAPAWEFMIKRVTKSAAGIADAVRRAGPDEGADDAGLTLEEWAKRYTRSKTVASLFQALAASMFTVNADEMSAHTFFSCLRKTGGYKTFGFAPQGNVGIAKAVAAAIEERGGEVRTEWTATMIEIEESEAVAVLAIDAAGARHRLPACAVISDIGPVNTAKLVADSPLATEFEKRVEGTQPTSMLALAFSTREEILAGCPGMMNFTDTKRLCSMGNMTALCPELAPEGRKLYDAYSVPRPSLGGEFDVDLERRLLEEDLAKVLPGFDDAETVLFKVMRGNEKPAMRCAPGKDPGVRTPVANLVDVGDGVKPDGTSGTTACAMTARIAVDALLEEPALSGGAAAA
ncbi:MAG: FAD-dependent oxidoreductase [Thermoleophilaceae bacterium]